MNDGHNQALNSPAGQPRPTLLVVEDDPQLMSMMQIILEGAGYGVVLASNGHQALEALERSRRDNQPVDLMMMDLNMPVMDGRECLRQMHAMQSQVPVLLLSGESLDNLEDDLLGQVAGTVQKPVGLRILLGQVRRILSLPGQA